MNFVLGIRPKCGQGGGGSKSWIFRTSFMNGLSLHAAAAAAVLFPLFLSFFSIRFSPFRHLHARHGPTPSSRIYYISLEDTLEIP